MTRKMFAMAALGALAAATPAAAQWGGSVVDSQSLRAEIDAGVARGDISAEDAASLRSQLRGLINLQNQYAQDGLSYREREDLRQRVQGLRNEIANAEGSGSGYATNYNGYNGYGNRYGGYNNGYGGYNNGYRSYGNNGYGAYNGGTYGTYGNRGYNGGSYGTYDNRAYGNGYGYDNGYAGGRYGTYGNGQYDRSDRYGGNGYRDDGRDYGDESYDENGDLRVGDRVSGGLEAVPDAYRYRFRDGSSVYYRYGNGNVYQIDSRSGVVLRIFPVDD